MGKKKLKTSHPEASESLEPSRQFLVGEKCHIHPANFGKGRLNLFQKQLSRYGGELVQSLPDSSDAKFCIIFEESVDENKVKILLNPNKYKNSVFVRCTWLVECLKAKRKLSKASYEIIAKVSEAASNAGLKDNVIDSVVHKDSSVSDQGTTVGESHQQSSSSVSQSELVEDDLEVKKDKEVKRNLDFVQQEECEVGTHKKLLLMSASQSAVEEDLTSQGMQGLPPGMKFPKTLQDKFVCARPSSSKKLDLNLHITSELEKLATTYKSRNDTWRAVSYQKAISAIRNYPKEITSREEAKSIPGVGERLADKVAEILESGRLRKVAEVCEGEEAHSLRLFMGVWGAGPATAHSWYLQGFRSLDDLRDKATLTRHQQVGLKLYEDLNARIPRDEVAEIEKYVCTAAEHIQKGLTVTVCGSYRRGKATCGDVDILITHPDGHSHHHVFKPLLHHMRQTGFLTDDLVTQADGNQNKYLGVCRLPAPHSKHRRLDVIVVPYTELAPALMYFTGSAHFNRSMRLLATKMGMSLSEHGLRAGIVRQGTEKLSDGYLLDTPTEESIFAHLGLQYQAPDQRDH